ncbi:MAG: alpha/beta fold hydrolase [Pseudomonadota bacterium]
MTNHIEIKKVTFFSEGQTIGADLYLPQHQANSKTAAVVLCHGFGGIKEVFLPSFAKKFAENGMVALCFDYRGFGDSDGQRGYLIPSNQHQDIKNAITYITSLDVVDRNKIALWGSSFGGANAIAVAASDHRVKALSVQLTFGSCARVMTAEMTSAEEKKLLDTINKAMTREVTKNKALMLNPDQILTDAESKAVYQQLLVSHPEIQIKMPLSTLGRMYEFKPERFARDVNIPTIVIAAENDIVCPASESEMLFDALGNNIAKKYVNISGAKHYDVYEGEYFNRSVEASLEWFNSYLVNFRESAAAVSSDNFEDA